MEIEVGRDSIGNSYLPFWKQADILRQGHYQVLRIFPPSKYPTGTLGTSEFKLSIPPDQWETLVPQMREAYKEGEGIHITVKNGKAMVVCPSDVFTADWVRRDWGASVSYDPDAVTFVALESAATDSDEDSDDVPF